MSRRADVEPPDRAGWSSAELATLAELAETFVRGGSVRRANLAAEALIRAADPAQVRQLRLVLRLLESRAANLAPDRPARRRSATGRRPTASAYLLGWAHSPARRSRRSAFQAFRKLLTFLAYADPGPPGRRQPAACRDRLRAGPAAGHDGARRRSGRSTSTIRPPGDGDETDPLEADVVVVGSGAGGGVIAAELTRGRPVGRSSSRPGRSSTRRTLPTDELDAFDRALPQPRAADDLGRRRSRCSPARRSAAGRSSTG